MQDYILSNEVARAQKMGLPVLAFESAVITHGLPRPENLSLAQTVEQEARDLGVTPATVALLDGQLHVGLTAEELARLASAEWARKISRRDFGLALSRGEMGGTTVAGTLIAAKLAGIKVFATGGIGGVHRGNSQDISADLPELARSPVVVVCAGAKSILDLPATLEVLETFGVPVLGMETDEFPAFYSRESGLPVTARIDSAQEAAEIATRAWRLGLETAVLVVVPPPVEEALSRETVESEIEQALQEAQAQGIRGAEVTPFLLSRVAVLSHGASLKANLALLRQNARVGAEIARALARHPLMG